MFLSVNLYIIRARALIFCLIFFFSYSNTFTLKISKAAFNCYICPHVHRDVAAARIEHLSRKTVSLTRETLRERRLDAKSLASVLTGLISIYFSFTQM